MFTLLRLIPKHALRVILSPRCYKKAYLVSLAAIRIVQKTYSAGKLKLDLVPTPRHEAFVSGDRVTDFKG